MKNLTPELIAKAKAAKSPEELFELAKENNVEITEEEAKTYFEQLHTNAAVSDDELETVAGGGSVCDFFKDLFGLRSKPNEKSSCPNCGDKPDKTTFDTSITPLPYDSNGKSKIDYL